MKVCGIKETTLYSKSVIVKHLNNKTLKEHNQNRKENTFTKMKVVIVYCGVVFVTMLPIALLINYAIRDIMDLYGKCICYNGSVICSNLENEPLSEGNICNTSPRVLDLSRNSIDNIFFNASTKSLPLELDSCENLEILNISRNRLQLFMWTSFQCCNLRVLDISRNQLRDGWFIDFESLRTLLLSHNNFSVIPNSISYIFKLVELDISYNNIYIIDPLTFLFLTRLRFLNISFNKIKILNKETIQNFIFLETLDVSGNPLQSVPQTFCAASNLKKINLSRANIDHLSTQNFYCLRNLKILDLSHNKIPSIPKGIFEENGSLEFLDLSHNRITQLNIKARNNAFTFLETLNVSDNNIERVSSTTFSKLQNMKILNLSHNKLSFLPENVFINLQSLEVLDLSYNALTTIPGSLFVTMKNLTNLDISNNMLTSLGNNFYSLVELRQLNLSWNFLIVLHDETFADLRKVESLDVSMNILRLLPDAESKGLSELRYLNVSGNQLSVLPTRWLQNCRHLKQVLFQGNEIDFRLFVPTEDPDDFYADMEWAMYWPTKSLSPIMWVVVLAIMVVITAAGCRKPQGQYVQQND